MLGRRRNAGSAPAPEPAAPALVRSRDEWRTVPPLPAIVQPFVTTLAAQAFSGSLSTWRNPSFLAPLGHHIDRDGPAGLITGVAAEPASPRPQIYHRDWPVPPAVGRSPLLQRAAASQSVPPTTRSRLVSATDVEPDPILPPVVSADLAKAAGGEAPAGQGVAPAGQGVAPAGQGVAPAGQVVAPAGQSAAPEPPGATTDPPVAAPAPQEDPAADPGAAEGSPSTSETARPDPPSPVQPTSVSRTPMDVPPPPPSPQAPPARRLGLGAPLSDVQRTPDRPPAPTLGEAALGATWRVRPVGAPLPASSVSPPTSAPPRVFPPSSEHGNAIQRTPNPTSAPPGLSMPAAPSRMTGQTLEPPAIASSALPSRPVAADGGPTARGDPGTDTQPEETTWPERGGQAGRVPFTAATPPGPPESAAVQAHATQAPLLGEQRSQPSTAAASLPELASVAERTPPKAGSAPAPTVSRISLPSLPHVSPGALMAPPEVTVAPLLGQRQPIRELDTVALDTVPLSAAASSAAASSAAGSSAVAWPAPPERTPAGPGEVTPGVVSPGVVQRPVVGRIVTGSYEHATGPAGGPPVRVQRELANWFADPGAGAIARGLAHRARDGSVVFDIHRSPEFSLQDPPALPHHDQPAYSLDGAYSFGGSGPSGTVQRQEAAGTADPPASPVDSLPSRATMPAALAASAAPAAPGPAGPPLDELARQLFGPLAARLKAELRLDRERAGLTDLRY